MKHLVFVAALALFPCVASAQQAQTAQGGELRVLDKLNGTVTDVSLSTGESTQIGHLSVTLTECRYPRDNPSGDAYANLLVTYRDQVEPAFEGWLIASAPALNAMEHPRYDVWVLRCIRS
ncbi:hypothetical protein FHS72_002482 [Loktanella ponticola]|uniref:DUF2155 domain-containing protein n=1 Tax=Yoonia ponticola TaxID=1524255 RepID=A0A7W9BM34_9RHOB|nr:DUF2155 domain-containing protein [Yoonia ponticola]MBB5722852.1 hypothetical protein [Yoonia ponticola]